MIDVQSKTQWWYPSSKAVTADSKLVSEIYESLSAGHDIPILTSTRYLENYLWRTFHCDVTNTHLMSIVAVMAYLGQCPPADSKLEPFVARVLAAFHQPAARKGLLVAAIDVLAAHADNAAVAGVLAPLWGGAHATPARAWLGSLLEDAPELDDPELGTRVLRLLLTLLALPRFRLLALTFLRETNYVARTTLSNSTDAEQHALLADVRALVRPSGDGAAHAQALQTFQAVLLAHYPADPVLRPLVVCQPLALTPAVLSQTLALCSLETLRDLCAHSQIHLHARMVSHKAVVVEVMVQAFTASPSPTKFVSLPLMPCEATVVAAPLAVPRMALLYLSANDFLSRSLRLLLVEHRAAVRATLLQTLERMQMRTADALGIVKGQSRRMARVARLEVQRESLPSLLGRNPSVPETVLAEVAVDLSRTKPRWALAPGDLLFLVTLARPVESPHAAEHLRHGLKTFRAATVVSAGSSSVAGVRTVTVALDPVQYVADRAAYLEINYVFLPDPSPALVRMRAIQTHRFELGRWLSDRFLGPRAAPVASAESVAQVAPAGPAAPPATGWKKYPTVFAHISEVEACFPHHQVQVHTSKRQRGNSAQKTAPPPYALLVEDGLVSVQPYTAADTPSRLAHDQQRALVACGNGLTLVEGAPGTGKTFLVAPLVLAALSDPHSVTLVVAKHQHTVDAIFAHLHRLGALAMDVVNVGAANGSFGAAGAVRDRLPEVQALAGLLGVMGAHGDTCETARYFYASHVEPRWARFLSELEAAGPTAEAVLSGFPFWEFFGGADFGPETDFNQAVQGAVARFAQLRTLFAEVAHAGAVGLLHTEASRLEYMVGSRARVVGLTIEACLARMESLQRRAFTLCVVDDAALLTEFEHLLVLALTSSPSALARVVLLGDNVTQHPFVASAVAKEAQLGQLWMRRLVRQGCVAQRLTQQHRARRELAAVYAGVYAGESGRADPTPVAGLAQVVQAVGVAGAEQQLQPGFFQNVEEAEMAVVMAQHMRVLGHAAELIALLSPYASQVALLKEVWARRCEGAAWWGTPDITTPDQAQERLVVVCSLVRTSVVADEPEYSRAALMGLTRAAQGLYLISSPRLADHLSPALPLRQALATLGTPGPLEVILNEAVGSKRTRKTAVVAVEDFEHFRGQVYERALTMALALPLAL